MLPAERKRRIVELVTENDGYSVAALAERLDFSKATIRRDLRELEEEGLVERSHGGAVPASSMGQEESYGQKEVKRLEAKRAIADRAVQEIRRDQVVCFDAGTTTMEVAKRAPDGDSFLAVTNSPLLAHELASSETTVKLTGGTLRPQTQALVGPTAERFLDRRNFDVLFLGTNSVDAEAGLSTPNEEEAAMKSKMIDAAERVVLVADGSKHGDRSFVRFADLSEVDLYVTDSEPPAALADAADDADLAVEVVSP